MSVARPTLMTLAALLAPLLACDTVSSKFDRREHAEQAIAAGWLPASLPANATDVWESHSIDTQRGHGGFSFSKQDSAQLRQRLLQVNQAAAGFPLPWERLEQEGSEWWCEENFFLAIDWRNARARFWRCTPC